MRSRRAGGLTTNSFLHRLVVRRRGRRDGRAGVPALEDNSSSDYEKQILSRGGQHMAQVSRGYDPKIRETEAKREAVIERFRLLTDRFVEEMGRYDAKRELLGRDVMVHFVSRSWYRAIMFVIALGEFALNGHAFGVFQEPLILTLLMAGTIGVGIPWVAHGCGIWVRQWPKPAWKTGVRLAVVVAGVVPCLIGINAARGAYLAMEGLKLGAQEQVLQQAFLAINLFVFLAATVLSYFAHEEDQELDILHQRVSRLDRKLDGIDAEIHRLNGEAGRLRASESAEREEIKAIIGELVSMYRGENVLARKDGQKPKAFDTEPALVEPSADADRPARAREERLPIETFEVEPSADADRPARTQESEVDKIRQRRLRAKADLAEARAGAGAQSRPPA